MIKTFLKYFLLISVILLSGYNQLYPNTNDNACFSSLEGIENTEQAKFVTPQDNLFLCFDSFHSLVENDAHKIHATDIEIEEDELPSLKKNIEIRNYFTSHLYNLKSGSFFVHIKKSLSFYKIFYSPFFHKLYVVFSVFRI